MKADWRTGLAPFLLSCLYYRLLNSHLSYVVRSCYTEMLWGGGIVCIHFKCKGTLPTSKSLRVKENYVPHSKTFKPLKQRLESLCTLPCSHIKNLTMNPARLSNLCWKSFHSSSPLTLPAFSALNICSSVSGCRDASATFSTGSIRSKTSFSGKLTRHISRYT